MIIPPNTGSCLWQDHIKYEVLALYPSLANMLCVSVGVESQLQIYDKAKFLTEGNLDPLKLSRPTYLLNKV